MAAPLIPKLKGIPTVFGEVFECNVTFCVDTSGSMYKAMDVVKEHLVETLLKMASKSKPCTFNVIEFNSEVVQWADKMVKCTPETVAVAVEWINRLTAKTGTNTQDALLAALSDPGCDSVYLVTDGLPDQLPQDILDEIGYASRNRPVHCIYLCTEDNTECAATEFLEDLAIETFGSFHIVTLTQHGCVERITPIYRQDHAHERVIRTLNGTLRDSSQRCGVATTLQVDPEETLRLTPRVSLFAGGMPPASDPLGYPHWWPAWRHWFLHPYRYYYPHGWSRYRPAKGWLKAQEHLLESVETSGVSPAAGALLIGKQVLARRIDDGYFYLGTVKSQVLSDKFLIAFGPCKHGKYKETSYQDTLIFDIIDYADAQRHSILSGDKVLAPWEPEGERYGPGVVIEGHEKRRASDFIIRNLPEGPDDCQITVTFTNGRTEKVPVDKAVWTPDPVYERLSLELKMPKEARMAMQTTDHYPKENLPGYPTSGPEAVPDDFSPPQPFGWDYEPVFMEGRPWMYPYVASAPMLYKKEDVTSTITRSTVKSEDVNKLIPGTNLTEKELHEKISSQLAEHKLELDERQTEKSGKMEAEVLRRQMEERRKHEEEERLRYEQMREQAARKEELERREAAEREAELLRQRKIQLEKDIEEEKILLLEKEKERHRLRLEEIERELHRRDRVIYEDKRISQSEDARNIQSDSRLLLKREQQEENLLKKSGVTFQDEVEAEEKKLERSDMIDSGVHISDDEEKYQEEFNFDKFSPDQDQRPTMHIDHCGDPRLRYRRVKRQTKDQTRPPWRKYWTTDNIPDIIQPPSHGPYRETANQAPLEARDMKRYPYACEWTSPVYNYVDPFAKHNYNSSVEMLLKTPQPPPTQKQQYIDVRGTRPSSAMTKEEARREYRRQRVAARTREWNERLCKEDMMKELMQDHHRERVLAQLQRDQDRLMKEQETIMQTRAAKRQIASDLKAKREEAKLKKEEKDRRRIEAMRQRREVREEAMAQKQKEEECIAERRQEAKEKRSQQRWDSVHQRLEQEEKENQQQAEKVLNAKLRRAEHFQKLEQQGQANKDLRIKVTDQHLAMYRSQVLP